MKTGKLNGSLLFDAANVDDLDVLSSIEKEALRIITGARYRCNIEALYNEVSWPPLDQRRKDHKICTLGKVIIKRFPNYFISKIGDRLQMLNFQMVRFSSSHHKSQEKFTFYSVMIFWKNYVDICNVTWPPHRRVPTFRTCKISASPKII